MSTAPLFFLSYARVAPLSAPQSPSADPDPLDPSVRTFYVDLSRRVGELLKGRTVQRIGFLDAEVPAEADWRADRQAALRAAEVFVPLYSPPYFRNSWSMEEHNAYVAKGSGAIVPVLWTPLGPGEQVAEAAKAVAVGGGTRAYERNGLRALCRLSAHRRDYLDVVDSVAARVVAVADSAAPRTSDPQPSALPATGPKPAPYIVGVLALTKHDRAARGRGECYGARPHLWRPFGPAQAIPIAEYAEIVAQRLGLPTEVVEVAGQSEHLRGPGVLLIDPWVMEVEAQRHVLSETVVGLPPWVACLVITNPAEGPHGMRGEQLAKQVSDMLRRLDLPTRLAHELIEFDQLMPRLVGESRRAYLKYGRVIPGDRLPRPRKARDD